MMIPHSFLHSSQQHERTARDDEQQDKSPQHQSLGERRVLLTQNPRLRYRSGCSFSELSLRGTVISRSPCGLCERRTVLHVRPKLCRRQRVNNDQGAPRKHPKSHQLDNSHHSLVFIKYSSSNESLLMILLAWMSMSLSSAPLSQRESSVWSCRMSWIDLSITSPQPVMFSRMRLTASGVASGHSEWCSLMYLP